jgi:hypothetical protein
MGNRINAFARDTMSFSYYEDPRLTGIDIANRGEAFFYDEPAVIVQRIKALDNQAVKTIFNNAVNALLEEQERQDLSSAITNAGGLNTVAGNIRRALSDKITEFDKEAQFLTPAALVKKTGCG